MRIAMFTPLKIRCGISDYSQLLISALQQNSQISQVSVVEPPENAVVPSTIRAMAKYRELDRAYRAKGRITQLDMSDVTHVQHQYFFFGGVAGFKNHATTFYKSAKKPLVVTVHEIAMPPENCGKAVESVIRNANRDNFLHPAISHLIVHTALDKERLLEMGAQPDRVIHIPMGIPLPAVMPEASAAKKQLDLTGKRVVTLFGFLAKNKGHHVALEMIQMMEEDVVLLLAGDQHPDDQTPYVDTLKKSIDEMQLQNRVRITGFIPSEDIPSMMAATDVAIAPFIKGSGSASLSQLLGCGKAIIASDIEPNREIAGHQPPPLLLFPSGDSRELAHLVQEMLKDVQARKALENRALKFAKERSYQQMAQQTVEVYREAVAMQSGRQ